MSSLPISQTPSEPKRLAAEAFSRLTSWMTEKPHALYGLAIMRITYGFMTAITLLLYIPQFSYTFGEASRWGKPRLGAEGNGFPWPIDSIFMRSDSDDMLYMKTAVLFLFAIAYGIGYKTRFTGPIFVLMWLSFATLNPQVTNSSHFPTLRILLIFMLFAHVSKKWSLDAYLAKRSGRRTKTWDFGIATWVTNLLSNTAVLLIGFQVMVIYVISALWKLQGTMWAEGTAIYYPLRVDELTFFPWLNDALWHITPFVFIGSWIGVYAQLLFPLSLLNRYTKATVLVLLLGMHVGIGLLMALPLFSAMMIAADMIFVKDKYFDWAIAWMKEKWPKKAREHNV